jgi:type II secretory pathway pseudopilin PulG
MKLRAAMSAPKFAKRSEGFTMVEIAIALGVIAFALIAIIGILPIGLQTQRDVREETIVNQDARVLIEAIKSGGRDVSSDLGSYVVHIDNDPTDYSTMSGPLSLGKPLPGIWTTNLVQLLTDTANGHTITFSAIGGAVASRGSEFALRYQVTNTVVPVPEYDTTPLSNQVYEVRLRFTWPVLGNNTVGSQANRYVVRTLVTGTYKDGFLYAQHYWNANYTNAP